jgi:hypothetical protein
MPIFTGSYAPRQVRTLRERIAHRWSWLRHSIWVLRQRPWRLTEEDTGGGYVMHREWGRWVLRPVRGWRSVRRVTPPTHATRAVPADDRDAALLRFGEILGVS